MEAILYRLVELFQMRLGRDVSPDDDFADLDVDSLTLVELSLTVEQEFHVRLNDRVLEVNSLRELAELVADLQQYQTH